MGDVRLARMSSGDRELVFAFTDADAAVWGWDPATGEEWSYSADRADELREPIARAVAESASTGFAAATGARTIAPGTGADLSSHLPGHAVLARVAALHAEAAARSTDDLPGVLDDEIVNWCVGFTGEEATAAELGKLPSDWRLLHAVPVGTQGSDIDHVLIGPAGVFAINSKHHNDQKVDVRGDAIYIGKNYQAYVAKSQREAERATAVAREAVPHIVAHPMIVVIGARLNIKESPVGVTVLDLEQCVAWLESLPATLDPGAQDALWEWLRWSDHWTAVAPPPAAPPGMAEFARRIAAERALVRDQRSENRRRTTSRRPATGGGATSRAGHSRAGARSQKAVELWRVAVLIAVLVALLLFGKQIASLLQSAMGVLTRHLVPTSAPTTSASPPVSGKACTAKGASGKTAQGRAVTCLPTGGGGTLTWHTAK